METDLHANCVENERTREATAVLVAERQELARDQERAEAWADRQAERQERVQQEISDERLRLKGVEADLDTRKVQMEQEVRNRFWAVSTAQLVGVGLLTGITVGTITVLL